MRQKNLWSIYTQRKDEGRKILIETSERQIIVPVAVSELIKRTASRIEPASVGLKQHILARGGVRRSLHNRPMDGVYLSPKPKMLTNHPVFRERRVLTAF